MAIPELIKAAKTSSIIATMEQSLRDMKNNIDIAVKDREGNLSSIRKQRQHYSDEIKQIRVKINSHLIPWNRGLWENWLMLKKMSNYR
jgi:predicted  nucleic acid-binding Zn-ribbon protein